jgi:hypothetical protein
MKLQRLLLAMTIVNAVLLAFLLSQTQTASAQDIAAVLRGRSLEIVDDAGTVRASITKYAGGGTYSDISRERGLSADETLFVRPPTDSHGLRRRL